MNKIGCVLLAGVLCAAVGLADDRKKPEDKGKTPEEIRRQIAALQKQEREAERIAGRQQEFNDIREQSKRRLAEYAERRKHVEEREDMGTDERIRYTNALLTHLNACQAIEGKLLVLKDQTALEEARSLCDRVEFRLKEWYTVKERNYDMTAQIADMRNTVKDVGRPELLEKVKQIRDAHQADLEMAKKEFEVWKARYQTRRKLEAQIRSFWDEVEKAEAEAEAEEAG